MLKNLFTKQHHLIYPALTLGGIYFVVANILKILPVYVPTSVYMFCVGLLLAALFVLFTQKSFPYIRNIEANYPKINRYLQALGAGVYVTAFTTLIPQIYFAWRVKSDSSYIVPSYAHFINSLNWIILLAFLLLATYFNFVKKPNGR